MAEVSSFFPLHDSGSGLLDHHYSEDYAHDSRRLETDAPVWQTVLVSLSIFVMLTVIVMDKMGPDWVMVATLALFMVTGIVSTKEAVEGFANNSILTIMVLLLIGEGIGRTGALDYYMGKILGKPKTIIDAQIRLMIPTGILSAFFSNTAQVAVMVPLVQRWAQATGIPRQQLMIPLSYTTILGGTCVLIGTSSNLVVSDLLKEDYSDEPAGNIGIFDLGAIGVPNMLIGFIYIVLFSPYLLPYGDKIPSTNSDALLLGARVTSWSPSAGRAVGRSGLSNSGGLYLVNVLRAATGKMEYAVNRDFVVNVGDELYFSGSVGEFAEFCARHGLEVITADDLGLNTEISDDIGTTLQSIMITDDSALLQIIEHLSNQIAGREPVESGPRPSRVIVASDVSHSKGGFVVGVDCVDRPGLLPSISSALLQLGLTHPDSESEVFDDRSLSIWRCEADAYSSVERVDVWTVVTDLLKEFHNATGKTKSATLVVRAVVTKVSSLIGKKPDGINFRDTYKAAIVAYQKQEKNASLNSVIEAGDVFVLQAKEDSPLVRVPPPEFYKSLKRGFLSRVFGSASTTSLPQRSKDDDHEVWKNLRVDFEDKIDEDGLAKGEFLTAFVVPPNSPLENQSTNQLGYKSLPGAVLVNIERPKGHTISSKGATEASTESLSPNDPLRAGDILWISGSGASIGDLQKMRGLEFFEMKQISKAEQCLQDRRLIEAVVAKGSPLVGKTVVDANFRSEYGGAVIAIQRGSGRIHEHPCKVKLETGDALLIQAGPLFFKHNRNNYRTFALVCEVENSSPPRPRLFLLCVLMIVTILVLAALEISNLLITATIVGVVMVGSGVVTQQEARDCLQWDLYMVLACAFGIGTAMENSGVALGLATFMVDISFGLGGVCICLLKSLFVNVLSDLSLLPF
jgi:di/tricarboxylate transporter